MTEPREFDSLDELFRQTFQALPESPAPNGWDLPSEQVWEHVQQHLPRPKQGWSWRTWSMVGALAAVLALGLYWTYNAAPTPAADTNPSLEQPVFNSPSTVDGAAEPASETVQTDEQVVNAPPADAPPQRNRAASPSAPLAPSQADSNLSGASDPAMPMAPRPKYPNNAERRRAEELRNRWNTVLTPLPTVLEKKRKELAEKPN